MKFPIKFLSPSIRSSIVLSVLVLEPLHVSNSKPSFGEEVTSRIVPSSNFWIDTDGPDVGLVLTLPPSSLLTEIVIVYLVGSGIDSSSPQEIRKNTDKK